MYDFGTIKVSHPIASSGGCITRPPASDMYLHMYLHTFRPSWPFPCIHLLYVHMQYTVVWEKFDGNNISWVLVTHEN